MIDPSRAAGVRRGIDNLHLPESQAKRQAPLIDYGKDGQATMAVHRHRALPARPIARAMSDACLPALASRLESDQHEENEDELEGEDGGLEDLLGLLTDGLEAVVASTVAQRLAEPARVFAAHVVDTGLTVIEDFGDTDVGEGGLLGCRWCLPSWLVG